MLAIDVTSPDQEGGGGGKIQELYRLNGEI